MALKAYEKFIGLRLADVAVDCCIMLHLEKPPWGGEKEGRSPVVDRGKRGIKRSTAVDAEGIPLRTITAAANRHDSPLLGETLLDALEALGPLPERVSVHLDRGDDSEATRKRLEGRGLDAVTSQKGKLNTPLQTTKRCVVYLTGELVITFGSPSPRWPSLWGGSFENPELATAWAADRSLLAKPLC